MITEQRWGSSVVVWVGVMSIASASWAATSISVTQRSSKGHLGVFAGQGASVDQSDDSDSSAALDGSFTFDKELDALILDKAEANGKIKINDDVSLEIDPINGDTLTITASHTATSTARWLDATGIGRVRAGSTDHAIEVVFTVSNAPAYYNISGSFDPGDTSGIGSTGSVQLRRPFSTIFFDDSVGFSDASISGILQPERTYQFRIRLSDDVAAGSANPFANDTSNYNITLTVSPHPISSIPEPATAAIVAGILLAAPRRRPRVR